ncbi:MAG: tetratricopeptide repeat protein [Deltaproteobacteria bacterium]|nr:tetratricopeptide repeat protein [Deltaproteobacteria bacterium]
MENGNFPSTARKRVIMFLLGCLAVVVFATVVYRVEHPSIVQHEERREMPGGGMGNMDGMANISVMMKRLQDRPEDVDAMRSLGMAFMEMEAWDKAVSFWDMILNKTPDDVMALNQKGICLFEVKRFAEAADQFERMLAIEPANYHAHFNLGILYKHYLEQPDKAAGHFQTVIDAKPEDRELVESARRELGGK